MKSLYQYLLVASLLILGLRSGNAQTIVQVLPPDSMLSNSVIIQVRCIPNTNEHGRLNFYWGRDKYYNENNYYLHNVSGNGQDTVLVSQKLTGFLPNSLYYLKIVTNNSQNAISFLTPADTIATGLSIKVELKDTSDILLSSPIHFGLHTNATYCMDNGFNESELPPPPPGNRPGILFYSVRSTSTECYPINLPNDFRSYYSENQIDTFKIKIDAGDHGYPVKLVWSNLKSFFTGNVILTNALKTRLFTIDMKSNSEVIIENEDTPFAFIIAEHPKRPPISWPEVIGDTMASIIGKFNPQGVECYAWIEYGLSDGYGNSTQPQSIGSGITEVRFEQTLTNLLKWKDYHYRLVIQDPFSTYYGYDQIVRPAFTSATLQPPVITNQQYNELDTSFVMLKTTISSYSLTTRVWFEYGTSTSYSDTTSQFNYIEPWSGGTIYAYVNHLYPMTTYHFRAVADNDVERVFGPDMTFTTYQIADTPGVSALGAVNITMTSATLKASIQPNGSDVRVTFACSPETEYWTSVSIPALTIPANIIDTVVEVPVTGLLPGISYKYRVGASALGNPHAFRRSPFARFYTVSDSTIQGMIVPLFITGDHRGYITCHFGVHTYGTPCVDGSLGEYFIPPQPPLPFFDVRFIDPHYGNPPCYDMGATVDLRPYVSPTQIDTFKLKFQPGPDGYPIKFQWPNLSGYYTGPVTMKMFDTTINMMETDSVLIYNPDISIIYIIAEGPLTTPNVPNTLSLEPMFIENGALVQGYVYANGKNTNGWFEWGATSSYGNTTGSRNILSSTLMSVLTDTLTNLDLNQVYHYSVVAQNSAGTSRSVDRIFKVTNPTGIGTPKQLPSVFRLEQNYPNPFNPSTVISYKLASTVFVNINIYNTLGQLITGLVSSEQQAGEYTKTWVANDLPGGVYFVRMSVSDQSGNTVYQKSQKLLLLK